MFVFDTFVFISLKDENYNTLHDSSLQKALIKHKSKEIGNFYRSKSWVKIL
jgi:hypothetical protein